MPNNRRYHNILYDGLVGLWCEHLPNPVCFKRYMITVFADGGPGYCVRAFDTVTLKYKNFRCYHGCFAENYMVAVSHSEYYDPASKPIPGYRRRLFVYHYEDVLGYPGDIVGFVEDVVLPRLELEPVSEDLYDIRDGLITGHVFRFNIFPSWRISLHN